ncbi:hypothetical protein JHK87_055167 [Glycine soja]|nr:hypothetical protein JHK87_055167 [Glycine soja]
MGSEPRVVLLTFCNNLNKVIIHFGLFDFGILEISKSSGDNLILATAYIRHAPWEMGVHKRNGVVYLDVCHVGYCFENLATEDPNKADGEGIHHVDANVEFCAVIKTKLGAHRILMGAEMDCCDSTIEAKRFYVGLKASCEIQSFLVGVPYIIIGFRDDVGHLVRTERFRTKDIVELCNT